MKMITIVEKITWDKRALVILHLEMGKIKVGKQ